MDLREGLPQLVEATRLGDVGLATRIASDLLQQAEAGGDLLLQAKVKSLQAQNAFSSCDFETALTWLVEAAEIYRKLQDHAGAAPVMGAMAVVEAALMRFDDAVNHALDGIELAELSGEPRWLCTAHSNLGCVLADLGEHESATSAFQRALGGSPTVSSTYFKFVVRSNVSWVEWKRLMTRRELEAGEPSRPPAELLTSVNATLAELDAAGLSGSPAAGQLLGVAGFLHAWSRDWPAVEDAVARGMSTAERLGNASFKAMIHGAKAEAALLQNDLQAALAAANNSVAAADQSREGPIRLHCLLLRARVLEAAGFAADLAVQYRCSMALQRQLSTATSETLMRVAQLQREGRRERDSLRDLSITDALTGLPGRRFLDDVIRVVRDAGHRDSDPLIVAVIDVNQFKRINDEHTHATGDRTLQQIADVLRTTLRSADHAIRLGGDEFVLLMPGIRRAQARSVVERLHRRMETSSWTPVSWAVSLCVGLAEGRCSDRLADLIHEADEDMYRAKRATRSSPSTNTSS